MKVFGKIGDAFRFLWKNVGTRVWLMVTSIVLALLLVISLVVTQNVLIYGTLKIVLGGDVAILGHYDGERKYVADYGSQNEALRAANDFTVKVEEEGIILLKNEDRALPLAKKSKISVFGKNSVNLVYGGSGSSIARGKMTDLYTALKEAEFEVNPTLQSFYNNNNKSGSGRGDNPGFGDIVYGFATGETPVSSYSSNEWNSVSSYSDAAIFVVSRIGGEGFDLPRTMRSGADDFTPVSGAADANDHYLQLDANERNLLKELYNRFDKVIILLNTPGNFELGFAEDKTDELYSDKLKGVLWMGFPGGTGTLAVGRVLNGEVTPSGHTTDTYAYDLLGSPAIRNFGNNDIEGGNSQYYVDSRGRKRTSSYYVDYDEGIYVGYRYYETRGAGDEQWYNKNVVYPFGFGKSYADFDWEITPPTDTALTSDGTLTFNVKVTNKSDSQYSGKDVVQLYYTAPYTSGEIEKSHVVLGGFAKTKLLAPGESDTVTIDMKVSEMKSYDYNDANGNGNRGYELDGGKYTLHIAHSAHDFEASFDFNLAEDVLYKTDDKTGAEVVNRFDDVSSHIESYLSRNSWIMPEKPTQPVEISEDYHKSLTWVKDDNGKPWFTENMAAQGANNGLELKDFIGIDYDDNQTVFTEQTTNKEILWGKTYAQGWELLLDNLTAEQMATLIGSGAFTTIKLDNIGKPVTNETDGPTGITSFMSTSESNACSYMAETVLSASWNLDLAYEMGLSLGNEALLTTKDGLHYTGWYAPAANIHRTPFGGRNWEYYSEDGFISGKFATEVIKGCKQKGVYCYMKHFAVNDQETDRDSDGLLTWLNEQAMREIYFKPFEMAVKDGETTAMMSSFNRIGDVWAGGDYRLLTQVLRQEWGFKGAVIDDYGLTPYINQEQVIRAGGDLMLAQGQKMPDASNPTATQLSCLRNATKHILYTVANSNIMEYNIVGMLLPIWLIALIAVDCAAAVGFAIWGYFAITKAKKKQQPEEVS